MSNFKCEYLRELSFNPFPAHLYYNNTTKYENKRQFLFYFAWEALKSVANYELIHYVVFRVYTTNNILSLYPFCSEYVKKYVNILTASLGVSVLSLKQGRIEELRIGMFIYSLAKLMLLISFVSVVNICLYTLRE